MRSIGTVLTIVLLAVGVAACGSGGSSTVAASNPSTQPSSTASATTGTAGGSTTASGGAAVQAKPAQIRQLADHGQRIVRHIASAAGTLATGHTASEQQARQELAQLKVKSTELAHRAGSSLPATGPAREVLVATGKTAASAANELQHMTINPATKRRMADAKSTLNGLAAKLGAVHGQVSGASISADASVAKDLAALKSELARGS